MGEGGGEGCLCEVEYATSTGTTEGSGKTKVELDQEKRGVSWGLERGVENEPLLPAERRQASRAVSVPSHQLIVVYPWMVLLKVAPV